MMRIVFFCAWLCLGGAWSGGAVGAGFVPTVFTDSDAGRLLPVSEAALPLGEFLSLDTNHLFALGLGIVVGVAFIAPQLEAGELTGVIMGVIGGDLFYRTVLNPRERSWLPEDFFSIH